MLELRWLPLAAMLVVGFAFASGGCADDEPTEAAAGAGGGGAGGSAGNAGSGAGGGSGGTSGSGGSGGSGGAGGTGGSAGSAGSAGASGSAGAAGSAADAGDGGNSAACNYLSQLGVQITAVAEAGQAPVAQGGTIVDGFYELIAVNLYGGATGTTFWRSLRFVGNELKTVERDGTASTDLTTTGTYTVNGSELVRSDTCPAPATHDFSYTATATSYTAYQSQGGNKVAAFVYQFVTP